MCLGDVAEVVELRAHGRAVVRVGARSLEASLLTLGSPVAAGDWLLVHSGFALARLSAREAEEALAIRSHAASSAAMSHATVRTSGHESEDTR